jgi:hypothetical protein
MSFERGVSLTILNCNIMLLWRGQYKYSKGGWFSKQLDNKNAFILVDEHCNTWNIWKKGEIYLCSYVVVWS